MNFVKILLKIMKRRLLIVVNWSRNRKEITVGKAFNLRVHLFKTVFCSKGQNLMSIIEK